MPFVMTPEPGRQLLRYVGDTLEVRLAGDSALPEGWRGFLRTNLGRADVLRREIVSLAGLAGGERTFAGASWRDIPLRFSNGGWSLHLPLLEVGSFRAKAFALEPNGRQHWPDGKDITISVHPDRLRTANTVYCAFPRLLGPIQRRELPTFIQALDSQGYTVIPPSGTLRGLTRLLPHVFDELRCGILHLLPLGPVPTTFARMGRYGSPYAQLDLTQIDPALVEFDTRATAEDQFLELVDGVHLRDGLLILDIVLNHTGWGSQLMSEHPDWYRRKADGAILSPGAWGNTWADLAELDPAFRDLWETVAESLLTWCRRGADGFRCDAGYMVPMPVWEYVLARVRQEFPDTLFLLEGLGGGWEATAERLAGGMQWAYSELFQNYAPQQVSGYLDHSLAQGSALGPLLHYSETHDNPRLAGRGPRWSLMRNRLSALSSQSGAWGFTMGVEWLAKDKVDVHETSDLRWGRSPNLVRELGALNTLVTNHPCFLDGAKVERLSPPDSWVLALLRTSADGLDQGLVLVNLDPDAERPLELKAFSLGKAFGHEALGQSLPETEAAQGGGVRFLLSPGWAGFLTSGPVPHGLTGAAYRTLRAQAAWALQCLGWVLPAEAMGPFDWRQLGRLAAADPVGFLESLRHLEARETSLDLLDAIRQAQLRARAAYPSLVRWTSTDARRVTLVPPGHPVLIESGGPFTLHVEGLDGAPRHLRAIPAGGRFVAALGPREDGPGGTLRLGMARHRQPGEKLAGELRYLQASPTLNPPAAEGLALLANGRGGYSRLHADLSRIESKYDALLAANLDPLRPCERHVLAKRIRVWAIVNGFLTALGESNLTSFRPGALARWNWAPHGGDGRCAALELQAWMPAGTNALCLRFTRQPGNHGRPVPAQAEVRLTVRLDLEDRSHHAETEANEGLNAHFQARVRPLEGVPGFAFAPAPDRSLQAWTSTGTYHPEPEWCLAIPHPFEAARGQRERGDAWSPGWFELVLSEGESVLLTLNAEAEEPSSIPPPFPKSQPSLEETLRAAIPAYLAQRGEETTVLAGYPWFLDWGRDSLIACLGLLHAGFQEEALSVLRAFGALERDGTLPNVLNGADDANRESSDAPLWFALAGITATETLGADTLEAVCGSRTLREVLEAIARGYLQGTPKGVRVDPASGLVWSPAHFTWMDTNHPAGSPREGFPIELQALWIRLLRFLDRVEAAGEPWGELAAKVEASLERFWREDLGYASDALHAGPGQSALQAIPDDHLRPNQLWLVALGLWQGARAQRLVQACGRHLLVPGALRSLAPLSVELPLPVRGAGGLALNDPYRPYIGRYEGDEDTRRKPAYHNGTGWVWLLPLYAEALAAAWPADAMALSAAKAILGSVSTLLESGCSGQLPELVDGDAPHHQKGCDAQAWSVTETLRVWLKLCNLG